MSSLQILPSASESAPAASFLEGRSSPALPLALLTLGFLVRIVNAVHRFLNPDEALHYLLSLAPSGGVAEHASLSTVHPPLLIVFLHYWGMLGHSEWFLRLPHVLAGTGFCWVMFSWLRRVTNHAIALMGLVLWLFSPTSVQLSTEIRQYAFLLLFSSVSLYFLDRGIEEDSPWKMCASAVALYLALLVHYSSLLVALTLGIYALARWTGARTRPATAFAWIMGQIGNIAIVAFLFIHHIAKVWARGQPEQIAETYTRRSIFWPGQEHAWGFVGRNTIRVFHYFFNQGAVGVLALLLFVWGIVLLVRKRAPSAARRPSPRQLAFLLVFPFVVNCATGLLRLYPYGGSRHDVYLAIFAMPPIAVALAQWNPAWKWWKPLAILAVFASCYLFPLPLDQYISFRNQNRKLMAKAVATLGALPAGSTIFTDDQGGMLLSYYLCDARVVQIEQDPFEPFIKTRCGNSWVVSLDPALWMFRADSFADTLQRAQQTYHFDGQSPLWLFQSGWYVDREVALRKELKEQYGCSASRNFGENILFCSIVPSPRR